MNPTFLNPHTITNLSLPGPLFGNLMNLNQGIILPFPVLPDETTPTSLAISGMIHN